MKTCPWCKKLFERNNALSIYCSDKCQLANKYKKYRLKWGNYKHEKPKICEVCKIEYIPTGGKKQRFCSNKCAGTTRKKFLSIPDCLENASRKLDKKIGCVRVYCPDHPKANTWGYVYEHRLIMEGVLGRFLEKDEHVHHKNSLRWDNRLENLEILRASDHCKRTHKDGRMKYILPDDLKLGPEERK